MEDNKDIEIIEQPVKKKRGRPRKVHPYEEFQPYIKETFANYLNDNYDMIYLFMNANKRIDKRFWNAIYEHVRTLNNKLYEKYSCGFKFNEYTYRPDVQWRDIDEVRETQRKNAVKYFYENENLDPIYKAYMIFTHMKLYISESSKEMKV